MEILGIWIVSIILTYFIRMSIGFKLFKDVADSGYKINLDKLNNIIDEFVPDDNKMNLLFPIYNIMKSTIFAIEYLNMRDEIINQLYMIDCLEEMTEYEKEEYSKKPSSLNAILLHFKTEIKIEEANRIKFSNNSIIYFNFIADDIVIYKAEGYIGTLSEKQQKEKILDAIRKKINMIKDNNGDLNTFISSIYLSEGYEIDLSDIDINEKNPINKYRTDTINDLKRLKEELLNSEDKIKKDKSLVKKRKK